MLTCISFRDKDEIGARHAPIKQMPVLTEGNPPGRLRLRTNAGETCLRYHSTRLKIKKSAGIERILMLLTGKRKYFCLDCTCKFRAPDRRLTPREAEAYGGARAAESLR
jgi:hypothetical protein